MLRYKYKMEKNKIKYLGSYVEGQFKPFQGKLKSQSSPADFKDEVMDFPCSFSSSYAWIDLACQAASKAQKTWQRLSVEDRKHKLSKLCDIFKDKKQILASVISRETGKPLWESLKEVEALIKKVEVTLNKAILRVFDQKKDSTAFVRHKARGVFVVLGPFNFPLHLPFSQILPALLSGNAVIFKPSEKTPASGQLLAQCFQELDLEKGLFQMLQGDHKLAEQLTKAKGIDGVLFVGSFAVAEKIKKNLLKDYWKILCLELGGYNSILIWDYDNKEHVIQEVISSCFLSSGQRCSSASQILLHKNIAQDFLKDFITAIEQIKIGHWAKEVYMGSLIDKKAFNRFFKFQKQAQKARLKTLYEGQNLKSMGGYYVSPAVYQASSSQALHFGHEETFTPQIIISEVDSTTEALKRINHSGYGLVLSLFSKNKKLQEDIFYGAKVGLFNVNRSTCGAGPNLPFGGLGKSGNDRPAGFFAIDSCVTPVACLEQAKN